MMMLSSIYLGMSQVPPMALPKSTVNAPAITYGKLSDFWNGTAYFERSLVQLPAGQNGLDEPAPMAMPDVGSDVVYTYYRMHVPANPNGLGAHDAIGLLRSDDGGATYYVPPGVREPVLDVGSPSGWNACDWDSFNVISPSVVKAGSTYYMVYEGANLQAGSPSPISCNPTDLIFGAIGLATSTDGGVTWNKIAGTRPGLFLQHNILNSFECVNIGAPFISYFNNEFQIFFHGNCGQPSDLRGKVLCLALLYFGCDFGVSVCLGLGGIHSSCPTLSLSVCNPLPTCPVGFRFDSSRSKLGMVHGTDITNINNLQGQVDNANPIMDVGVGAQSWDSRVNGKASVVSETDSTGQLWYYLVYEGSQYVFCNTYNFGGIGVNEGNWGWGLARTTNLNGGTWEKYQFNPIRQVFQNQSGCGFNTPHIFQFNGAFRVYDFHYYSTLGGPTYVDSNVLLPGTDPYLHLYRAVYNNGQGQCEPSANHSIGFFDASGILPAGWAQSTRDASGHQVGANWLCLGPNQQVTGTADYSLLNSSPSKIPAGDYAVTFEDSIDSLTCSLPFPLGGGCEPIVIQSITWNNGANTVSSMTPHRNDFQNANQNQDFEQQFTAVFGNSYEWRTHWESNAYTRLHWVYLRQLTDTSDNTGQNSRADIFAPSATMNSLPAISPAPFTVSWTGQDYGAIPTGIWSFDVQYQINGGSWTNLGPGAGDMCCTGTTATTYTIQNPQCFTTYAFRVRARDNSGNLGQYSLSVTTAFSCGNSFGLSASPTTVYMSSNSPTNSATSTLTLTSVNGYSGSVSLTSSQPISSPPSLDGMGTGFCHSTSSTHCTASLSTQNAGDMIVVFTSSPTTLTNGFSVSDTYGLTFNSRKYFSLWDYRGNVFEQISVQEFWAVATTSLSLDTITMTTQDPLFCCPGHNLEMIAFGISGSGDQFDGTPSTSIQSSGNPSVSISSTISNEMVIGYAIDGSNSLTAVSPLTFIGSSGNNGAEYTILSSPQSATVSFGNALGEWAEIADVVQPLPGFSFSFAPQSVPLTSGGTSTSAVTITTASFVPAGTYELSITGTNPFTTHTVAITAIVSNFSLSASPTAVTVSAGSPGTSTITVAPVTGFTGTVTLTSDTPGCSLSPISVPGSGTSTLSCTLTTASNYLVTVTGTSGSESHAVSVTYTVQDFVISSSPPLLNIQQGAIGDSTINLASVNGFNLGVGVTVTASSGITASVNPSSVTLSSGGTGSTTLTVTVPSSTPIGNYTVTVTGQNGALQHSVTIIVQVSNFQLTVAPASLAVQRGGSASVTLTLTSVNGYSGPATLAVTTIPSCVGYTISTPMVQINAWNTTLVSLLLSPSLSCNASSNVQATSGTLVVNTLLSLSVSDFSVFASPTSVTTLPGVTGTTTVTTGAISGFTDTVSLTTGISPSSGLSCSPSPNTVTGAGTSTLYCSGIVGVYTVTVTGTSGSIIHSTTLTVNVRDFSLTVTPTTVNIPDGRSAALTVQAASINGYSGTVSLSWTYAACSTWSFGKPSLALSPGGTDSASLTLTMGPTCYANSYSTYVTGYDSVFGMARYAALTVNASDFTIYAQIGTSVGIGGQYTLKYNVTYYDNNNYPGSILTQSSSFGANNCCLSRSVPNIFSITKPDSNSAPGLITNINDVYQSFSDPWNGQGFYAQGRDWVFYINYESCGTYGTTNCLKYATSTNGASWNIYNTGLVVPTTPSIVTNGTDVFYVRYNGVDTQSGKALMLGIGKLHPDGTIAWRPEYTVKPTTSGVYWYAESMRLSTTGQIFVAYNRLTSASGSGYPYVIHSNGVDYTTWQRETQLNTGLDDYRFSLVPLPNGQMYILYWPYWGPLRGVLWSNGSWSSQETITPNNTYVQQTAFGFSTGNSTVYAIWQERTSQKVQFAIRKAAGWTSPQTIFAADTNLNPRWSASYDPLHRKWYILYYSYSTNQIWEYSGYPGAWSGKTVVFTTNGATSNSLIGTFYNTSQVNTSSNTLGIFWTQYDASSNLQLKYGNATIFTGGSFPTTWPITSTGAGSGATSLTITASDGYITRSLTIQLTVNGYNVTYWYNPLQVNRGSSTAIYLQIFPEYGIPLTNATISPVTVPNCLTVYPPNARYFNIGPIGGYDFPTLPIAASSACNLGNYQVTVKVNGTSVHTYDMLLTFTVTVNPAPPPGGGGGSVAAGTLITLADGSQVPVQNLKVGMKLLSYDMTTHQFVVTTLDRFFTVVTRNQMEIKTATGKPLIVDQNPAQKLYVKLPDGTVTLLSVTELKVGYQLFEPLSQTWTPITDIHYQNGGNHVMYDLYTSGPGNYIANGYLDPLKM